MLHILTAMHRRLALTSRWCCATSCSVTPFKSCPTTRLSASRRSKPAPQSRATIRSAVSPVAVRSISVRFSFLIVECHASTHTAQSTTTAALTRSTSLHTLPETLTNPTNIPLHTTINNTSINSLEKDLIPNYLPRYYDWWYLSTYLGYAMLIKTLVS